MTHSSNLKQRAKEIFMAALEQATPEQKNQYLDEACDEEPELRREVEALLSSLKQADSFMEDKPAADLEQTAMHSTAAMRVGETIGPYKLLEEIGEGGMGSVWVAQQSQPIKRRVAIKLIKAGMDSKSVLARFEAERQALALMDHPNIARVLDGGMTEQGRPYFAMEYVKGVPLTEYCDQAKLSVKERLELFLPICNAVQHAHQKGIVHRDLKPTNILICLYDGKPVPKVIDFGLAKAMNQSLTDQSLYTAHGMMLGTPLYMSPEQAEHNNLDIDTRTDVYSLGVILYELLTGSTPLEKAEVKQAALNEMLRLIKEVEPPKPSTRLSGSASLPSVAAQRNIEPAHLTRSITGDLDWVVMKALEKERSRRYETANGFAMDIRRHLCDEPVSASPPSAKYRIQKFIKRNRTSVMAAGTVAFVLLLGVAGTTSGMFWALSQQKIASDAVKAQSVAKEKALASAQLATDEAIRATKAEEQTAETLKQVAAERDAKELALKKAEEEKQIAQAVKDFLQHKLLAQADTTMQANALLQAGGTAFEAKLNPTIRELLDRAAKELSAETIEQSFPNQPLVQAEILATVGNTYRDIAEFSLGIDFLKRADALFQQNLGPDHLKSLESKNELAAAYLFAGEMDVALQMFANTLKRSKTILGPNHIQTIINMSNLASAYQADGNLKEATALFEETLTLSKAILGPEHSQTRTTMNNLATTYQSAGKLDLALALYEETLQLDKTTFGPDHPDTLTGMNNLAMAYHAAGNLDLALPLLEETLKLMQAKLGSDHPTTLRCMINLGKTYGAVGQLKLAQSLLEQALKFSKTELGSDHPVTLNAMNDLAMAYQAQGRHDLALPLLEETLKLSKTILGPDHPGTLATMSNLAVSYQDAGQLDLAVQLQEESLELQKSKLGPSHLNTLAGMNNLAKFYLAEGKVDKALSLLEEALTISRASHGPEHPETFWTMKNLARVYRIAGKPDRALPLFEEALQLSITQLGPEHPRTLQTMNNLAVSCWATNQLDKSIPLFEKALRIQEVALGRNHPATLQTVTNLGVNYKAAGRIADAILLLEEAFEASKKPVSKRAASAPLLDAYAMAGETTKFNDLFKKRLGEGRESLPKDSPELASLLAQCSLGLIKLKMSNEAEPLLRECLAIREKSLPDNWRTSNTRSLLGAALLEQKNYEEAEPLLLDGYMGLKEKESTIPLQIRSRPTEALKRLVEFYAANDQPDKTAKWQAELDNRLEENDTAKSAPKGP